MATNPRESEHLASRAAQGELRLAQQNGAAADPPTDDLPPGFAERLAGLGPSPSSEAVRAEVDRLGAEADRLFKQLRSADNEVVQRARRRQIRTLLNAQRRLERLAPPPPPPPPAAR